MSILTIATTAEQPDGLPVHLRAEFAAGRADAYDDHQTLTTDQLATRAAWIIDLHPDLGYVQGYAAYAAEARLTDHRDSGRTEVQR